MDHPQVQLQDIPPGQVRAWFASDVVDALARLECPTAPGADPPLLAVSWPHASDTDRAIAHITRALAGLALARWPSWYREDAPFPSATTPDEDARAIERLGAIIPDLNPVWVRRAIRHCRSGERPVVVGLPHAVQVRQLMRALGEPDLVLMLALDDPDTPPASLLCFARVAAWFAGESGARVAAFVPAACREDAALDAITYGAVYLDGAADPHSRNQSPRTSTIAPGTPPPEKGAAREPASLAPRAARSRRRRHDEPLRLVRPPIIGRPHPASPGEQLLAQFIARDDELRPLFTFNQPVEAAHGETFVVDLLWAAGRLTVEVDGYTWHSGPHAFSADRYRDYRLLCGGYRTLRLPHDEVLDDPALQLEKIRDAVRAIVKERV
ncbi:MAG: DUF559 domain-containing protein [Candidatus Hydrogenedentes bacterium]|nr:DUF559 domain-containing protein [Candidatus Hydrogenedentota bacterium]